MVNCVVNAQKTVVGMSKNMNRYRRILAVVPPNIKLKLGIRRMRVDFCRDSDNAFVKQSQDTFGGYSFFGDMFSLQAQGGYVFDFVQGRINSYGYARVRCVRNADQRTVLQNKGLILAGDQT